MGIELTQSRLEPLSDFLIRCLFFELPFGNPPESSQHVQVIV